MRRARGNHLVRPGPAPSTSRRATSRHRVARVVVPTKARAKVAGMAARAEFGMPAAQAEAEPAGQAANVQRAGCYNN